MKTKKTVLLVILAVGFFLAPRAQSTGPVPELANYGFSYTDTSIDVSFTFKTNSLLPIYSMSRVFEDTIWNLMGFRRDTFSIINPPLLPLVNNLTPETRYRILLSFSYSPDLWNDSVGITRYEYFITTAPSMTTTIPDVPDANPQVWVFEKKLYIQSRNNTPGNITVYDMLGQIISETTISAQTIDLVNQPSGMYIVRIADDRSRKYITKRITL